MLELDHSSLDRGAKTDQNVSGYSSSCSAICRRRWNPPTGPVPKPTCCVVLRRKPTPPHPVCGCLHTLTISFEVAFFGVFLAVPLRKQVIVKEKLVFPSGTATAQVNLPSFPLRSTTFSLPHHSLSFYPERSLVFCTRFLHQASESEGSTALCQPPTTRRKAKGCVSRKRK